MTRRRLDGRPLNPQEGPTRSREDDPDAPSRLSIDKARVGNELSADPLHYDEAESTEAEKRSSESERHN